MGTVKTEDREGVRHIVISRAEKRNALSVEVVDALGEAFAEAAADMSVRSVVVRGDGAMFSSGMDLANLHALSQNPEQLRPFRDRCLIAWNRLEEMTKPTIAQIHGAAIGGAMEMVLAADFRVMADDAVIGIPEVRVGLLPDVGGCSRLPALVGLGRAKELIMTGRMIGAEEAHRIGLVTRIAPASELDAATAALVDELSQCAPLAVGLAKTVLDAAAKPALSGTLAAEVTAQQTLVASEDYAEGSKAFLEKRTPEFSGR